MLVNRGVNVSSDNGKMSCILQKRQEQLSYEVFLVTEKKTVKKLLRKATVEQKYSTELKRQKTEENPKGAVTR